MTLEKPEIKKPYTVNSLEGVKHPLGFSFHRLTHPNEPLDEKELVTWLNEYETSPIVIDGRRQLGGMIKCLDPLVTGAERETWRNELRTLFVDKLEPIAPELHNNAQFWHQLLTILMKVFSPTHPNFANAQQLFAGK